MRKISKSRKPPRKRNKKVEKETKNFGEEQRNKIIRNIN